MRVFVLSTGRCGSVTFARACSHLCNYSVGHEALTSLHGDARFAYPDAHIESDNRLSWFLGELGARFAPHDTLYVHLTRDPEQVARSFLRRWDAPTPAGIIGGFAQAILMRHQPWPEGQRLDVCRFYVDTVNRNIAEFMRHQPRTLQVRLESAAEDFERFLETIGAEGDLDAARGEWAVRHNASQ